MNRMSMLWNVGVVTFLALWSGGVWGQSFSFDRSELEISVAAGYNHVDQIVQLTPVGGFDLSTVSVSSDAVWVNPSLDAATGKVTLEFVSEDLVNASYTATLTATDGGGVSETMMVTAYASPLNIFRMIDDPGRPLAYGIQYAAQNIGSIVVFAPQTETRLFNITVGKKPTDLILSDDGSELLVINSVDQSISVIDLNTFMVKEIIALPSYGNWSASSTTANIGVGPGNIIYYVDGNWAPILRVLDRSTGMVLQSITTLGSSSYGFGDLVVSGDRTQLYAWGQHGWSSGLGSSAIGRYTIDAVGLLTFVEVSPATLDRDPREAPILISADDQRVFAKEWQLGPSSFSAPTQSFPEEVYAITAGGEIASTSEALYDVDTGNKLYDLPATATTQAISADNSRLTYFDTVTQTLKSIDLQSVISAESIGGMLSPADRSITLAPSELGWGSVPGGIGYNVYLSASSNSVVSATTASAAFKGEVQIPSYTIVDTLVPGVTYFLRIDTISPFQVTKGEVYQFTVSLIAVSSSRVETRTIAGHPDHRVSVDLDSAAPGVSWAASADVSWIHFLPASGTSPGSLEMSLDATSLAPGLHNGIVTVSDNGVEIFQLPVDLQVEEVNPTIIKSDPLSPFVYVISEDAGNSDGEAFLFEMNTVTEQITRSVEVGHSVTDLALHHGDNRLYVPNWLGGSLLAVNWTTFEVEETYAFTPYNGSSSGSGDGDIYRVSAGGVGRLIVEEEDQRIDIRIFDTVNGVSLDSVSESDGGGAFDAVGQRYYHGDHNSSLAELHSYDVTGDVFNELASVRVTSGGFFGSRVVTLSEDSQRIFWNGGVFRPDLTLEWDLGEIIHAATPDGRYAFSSDGIYDVELMTRVDDVPVDTAVMAFSGVTEKLAYNAGDHVAFQSVNDPNDGVTPSNGAIVTSPAVVDWPDTPTATSYDFYFANSDVANATTNDAAFVGTVAPSEFSVSPLTPGIYYWRVDANTPWGVIRGEVFSFVVSTVSSSHTQILAATVSGHRDHKVTVDLDGVGTTTWTARVNVPWVSIPQATGTTPHSLELIFDAGAVAAGTHEATLIVGDGANDMFALPITFTVDPLHLTLLKSDRLSATSYAISEVDVGGGPRAYLLELNTDTESVQRAIRVGSGVSDLAIHNADGRIYVPNWRIGALLAVDASSFEIARTYNFTPFGSSGTSGGDVYRVSAGAAGRLVIEEADQSVDLSLFDTGTGNYLGTIREREGGGGFGPNGRFYYHGDNNSSGATVHKYDVTGDAFSQLAEIRVSSLSNFGSRVVVVSDNGARVFWNGSAFDGDLVEEWTMGTGVYAASADGKYAIGIKSIFDVDLQEVVLGMPVDTTVSTVNNTSDKLVVQVGDEIRFYSLSSPITLPAPVVSAGNIGGFSADLNWIDSSLETGFTIEYKTAAASGWTELTPRPGRNVTSASLTGLVPDTAYLVRIKADTAMYSSAWSESLAFSTIIVPPTTPSLSSPLVSSSMVKLDWSNASYEAGYRLERRPSGGSWGLLATTTVDELAYVDVAVTVGGSYDYRVAATNETVGLIYSNVESVLIPAPQAPSAPGHFAAENLPAATILVTWQDEVEEAGYVLERMSVSETNWTVLTHLPADTVEYVDPLVDYGVIYSYRISATNEVGTSAYSQVASALAVAYGVVFEDDFDPDITSALWEQVQGGQASVDTSGAFLSGNALYFTGLGSRLASTVSLNVGVGDQLVFYARAGNEDVDGWNNAEVGDEIVVEYSVDGGGWTLLQNLDGTGTTLSSWTRFAIELAAPVQSADTRLRWRQLGNSGDSFDVWAIDHVSVRRPPPPPPTVPTFFLASANNDTDVSLLWSAVTNVLEYVVERSGAGEEWGEIGSTTNLFYTDTSGVPDTLYGYRLKAVNAYGASGYTPTSFARTYGQLEGWLLENYGVLEAVGSAALDAVGSDGVPNAINYAFDIPVDGPLVWHQVGTDDKGLPQIAFEESAGMLSGEFLRRKAGQGTGIRYVIEFCCALGGVWTEVSNIVSVESVDAVWERVRFEDEASAGNCETRFGRVRVESE